MRQFPLGDSLGVDSFWLCALWKTQDAKWMAGVMINSLLSGTLSCFMDNRGDELALRSKGLSPHGRDIKPKSNQRTGRELPNFPRRVFTVPMVIQQYMENYCLRNGIRRNDLMFPITERAVQKQLHIVCDYLGYEGISTHSFRKWYATEIYNANGFDIALVQRLLQHSSAATTQRYIGIEPQKIEQAIQNHAQLL